MHITIEFDHIQQDLMGREQEMDVEEGTTLLDFLELVDCSIEDKCSSCGKDPASLKVLNGGNLNSCIVAVNGQTPPGLLQYGLKEGDVVSLLYGYCGG